MLIYCQIIYICLFLKEPAIIVVGYFYFCKQCLFYMNVTWDRIAQPIIDVTYYNKIALVKSGHLFIVFFKCLQYLKILNKSYESNCGKSCFIYFSFQQFLWHLFFRWKIWITIWSYELYLMKWLNYSVNLLAILEQINFNIIII